MAYNAFTDNKPVGTDNGTLAIDYMRNNAMAARDAVVVGAMSGWTLTPSGGTAEEPAVLTYAKGTERLRVTLTWTSGNVTRSFYEYSSDAVSYTPILPYKYMDVSYDANGNVTGTTWTNT